MTMPLYRCANCQYEMQSEESLGASPAPCPKCQERTLVAVPTVQRPAPEPVTEPSDPLADLVAVSRAAQAKIQSKVDEFRGPPRPGRPMPGRPAVGRPIPGRPAARYAGAARGNAPSAVPSLVCGILAVVLGPLGIILGPIAVFMGLAARGEMARNPGRYAGEGMATAGIILGAVGRGWGSSSSSRRRLGHLSNIFH